MLFDRMYAMDVHGSQMKSKLSSGFKHVTLCSDIETALMQQNGTCVIKLNEMFMVVVQFTLNYC